MPSQTLEFLFCIWKFLQKQNLLKIFLNGKNHKISVIFPHYIARIRLHTQIATRSITQWQCNLTSVWMWVPAERVNCITMPTYGISNRKLLANIFNSQPKPILRALMWALTSSFSFCIFVLWQPLKSGRNYLYCNNNETQANKKEIMQT